MPRTYKPNRRWAPPLKDILELRQRGDSLADIADTYGCHRRTVYASLDRAADRGKLPPVMVPVLFPGDPAAQQRMATRIGHAHSHGVQVVAWEHVAMARELAAARHA